MFDKHTYIFGVVAVGTVFWCRRSWNGILVSSQLERYFGVVVVGTAFWCCRNWSGILVSSQLLWCRRSYFGV
ncbi:hypothetical protein [Pseudoalteromonas lipolytica]|uniref:hypothetical protein n=1 Tax=Pseudoalteromonas lipolytica TaxID=570156 RepID=UPI0004B6705D|nr:hypothetical protein [Pseudoalteromonas lipolytica]